MILKLNLFKIKELFFGIILALLRNNMGLHREPSIPGTKGFIMGTKIYSSYANPNGSSKSPWFRIEDAKLYPAYGHPQRMKSTPWFKILGEKIYPAHGNPEGSGNNPWYRLKEGKLYPTQGHPNGPSSYPWFVVR